MLLTPEQLIEQIHDSPTRVVMVATGGGSRAVADLLAVPGGSRTLLEAVVPYSAPAMRAFLGGMPDEFCSAATARSLAMAAFQRARGYLGQPVRPLGAESDGSADDRLAVGVACTASLATDRPKHGPHRIYCALQTVELSADWRLQLQKDRRTRAEEERLAGRLLLNVLAEACGIEQRLTLDLLEGEQVEHSRTVAPSSWQELLLGAVESVCISPSGRPPKVVFPGAFNPPHVGHRRIIEVAHEMLHEPVALEISIVNVDKPPLDYMEIERRVRQFPPEQTIYLTRAATFEEKSRLFPGAVFLVGADTIRRIAAVDYYGGSAAVCQCAVERLAARGCRFLVFGRQIGGVFVRLADLDLPDSLLALCREVPASMFREDVSSTLLRRAAEVGRREQATVQE